MAKKQEGPSSITLDARSLRGLAHPVRVRLLELLRAEGPSTATRLADKMGLASAATSYHLRQLALYGFVVEDEGRGSYRERWWRAAHQSTKLPLGEVDPESSEAADTFLRAVAATYFDYMQRAIDEWLTLPQPWRSAQTLSDVQLRLTVEELVRLRDEFVEVVRRYRRDVPDQVADAPPDSVPVLIQFQAFVRPGGHSLAARDS